MSRAITTFVGFRNLDPAGRAISQCMEAQRIYDFCDSEAPGIIALKFAGRSISDPQLRRIADSLPTGQKLWVFSPQARALGGDRVKVTHVVAESEAELLLKIADHLARFLSDLEDGHWLKPTVGSDVQKSIRFSGARNYRPMLDSTRLVYIDESDGENLEFLERLDSSSARLLIAVSRSKLEEGALPPEWNWLENYEESLLLFHQPDVTNKAAVKSLEWLTRAALHKLGLKSGNSIFYGAHIGGQFALQTGLRFPQSHIFVDTPFIREFNFLTDEDSTRLSDPAKLWIAQNRAAGANAFRHFEALKKECGTTLHSSPSGRSFVSYSQRHLVRKGRMELKPSVSERILSQLFTIPSVPADLLEGEALRID